ncbi:putative zinc finger transcription factor ace1 [Calycina marina]|uniref:Zinc finger transcription factor ace1 n=1 Tax=Calycina marina TaxID=1763456 RepID=A0A9P7YU32_9HELO|nr:putative zinc finger transcription factor ace1 [Calycina marina]
MSFTHPRRTTKTTSAALTPSTSNMSESPTTLNINMSLRKGSTFHSPLSSPTKESPSTFRVPALPRRSQTTLEDVNDAHQRRIELTIGDIERTLASIEDPSPATRQYFRDEADPVPRGLLDHSVGPATYSKTIMENLTYPADRRVLRSRLNHRSARYADSGLGSSIVTSMASVIDDSCAKQTASAITRSAATHSSTLDNIHRMSVRASNRIHEHILKPLLAKSSLKDYHPIVRDCTRWINEKEVVCLRDLEKTLIFMAPERTKTVKLYLDFCLTSIHCIQATVEYLSDREQTRPSDRPYSNGYFIDLVDQIKQYAQQVQAAKEKQEKGEALGDMDPESTDEVRLHGGLGKNGRPAELVRVKKNGKAYTMTGEPIDLEDDDSKGAIQFKRSLSEEAEDEESAYRSMARRKRSRSAVELSPKRCREPGCDKEFKRPCDLTKHEKTHSRPWKCREVSCKYHDYGWPTEKEMDRHHNDKHSAAPPMYPCKFENCIYKSKRESNCKQHMEKAHGWEYVRSKNNGKNRDGKPVSGGMPTPQSTHMQTPSSHGSVINTPLEDDLNFETGYGDQSAIFQHPQDHLNFPEYTSSTDIDMFGNISPNLQLDFSPASEMQTTSSNQSSYADTMTQDHFQENFHDFQNSSDFSLHDNDDLYNANVQLPTPASNIFQRLSADVFETSGAPYNSPAAHISPVGRGNTMLYTPTSLLETDEGFDDFIPDNSNSLTDSNADFTLYPTSSGSSANSSLAGLFGQGQFTKTTDTANVNFTTEELLNASAQELLNYYAVCEQAARQGNAVSHNNSNHNNDMDIDWPGEDSARFQ